jgi:hypothetical protein
VSLNAILTACGAGRLTPAEAKTLSDIIASRVEVALMKEVSDRLAALEAASNPKELTYRRVA